jgi:hypothetical protein
MADSEGTVDGPTDDGFDGQVEYLSRMLTLDAYDLKEAYKDRHQSLKVLFEEARAARPVASLAFMLAGALCGLTYAVYPPALVGVGPLSSIAAYYFGLSDGTKSQKVADIIKTEVSGYRQGNGTSRVLN